MEPVVQLLCGIAAGSDPAAACVIPHVMPILLQLYPALSQVCAVSRYSLLVYHWVTLLLGLSSAVFSTQCYWILCQGCCDFYRYFKYNNDWCSLGLWWHNNVCVAASPLRDYKDAITNVLQLALSQTELVCKEMACTIFSDLLSAKNLLDTSEVSKMLIITVF